MFKYFVFSLLLFFQVGYALNPFSSLSKGLRSAAHGVKKALTPEVKPCGCGSKLGGRHGGQSMESGSQKARLVKSEFEQCLKCDAITRFSDIAPYLRVFFSMLPAQYHTTYVDLLKTMPYPPASQYTFKEAVLDKAFSTWGFTVGLYEALGGVGDMAKKAKKARGHTGRLWQFLYTLSSGKPYDPEKKSPKKDPFVPLKKSEGLKEIARQYYLPSGKKMARQDFINQREYAHRQWERGMSMPYAGGMMSPSAMYQRPQGAYGYPFVSRNFGGYGARGY